MKKNRILFICLLVLVSCNQQKKHSNDLGSLKQINDKVAKNSKCGLTSHVSSLEPNKVDIKMGCVSDDGFLPGKILYEYFSQIVHADLNVNEFCIKDQENITIYTLTNSEISSIARKDWNSKSVIKELQAGNTSDVYNQLDTSVQRQIQLDDFKAKMELLNLEDMEFAGFQIFETNVAVSYINSENRMNLVYDMKSEEKKILGIEVIEK